MAQIGEIQETQSELKIEWKINDFFSLPEENDVRYESKKFYSCGASWNFWMYPNGEKRTKSEGWVSIFLLRQSFGAPITLEYTLGVGLADGDNKTVNYTHTFKEKNNGYGSSKLISRSILQEKKLKPSASDTLTVFATLKNSQPISVAGSLFSRHEKIADNLKDLLKTRKNTDCVLQVDGAGIAAHRMILEKSSPVFAAMFKHDTKESETGEVSIKDINKSTMDVILEYFYSGDMDELTTENTISLYAAAEKYDLQDIKDLCSEFIIRNLSVKWVCDVLEFAKLYDNEDIDSKAKEFFKKNAREILQTDNWKTFAQRNHDISIELLGSLVSELLPN